MRTSRCDGGAAPPPRHLSLWANSRSRRGSRPAQRLAAQSRVRSVFPCSYLGRGHPAPLPVHALPCCWYKAKNARGPGTASPVVECCATTEVRKNRMSPILAHGCLTFSWSAGGKSETNSKERNPNGRNAVGPRRLRFEFNGRSCTLPLSWRSSPRSGRPTARESCPVSIGRRGFSPCAPRCRPYRPARLCPR